MDKQIFCTLGPASLNRVTIERLTNIGVDLFRINLSHTREDEIEELVTFVRSYSDVPICFDTQGAQVRTGVFRTGITQLDTGQEIELVTPSEIGDQFKLPLYPAEAINQLAVGDLITLGSSSVPIQVVRTGSQYLCRVVGGGSVGSNQAVSIDRPIFLDYVTTTDKNAIKLGVDLGISHFALSFTNHQDDLKHFRNLISGDVHLIAKIESRLGLQNLRGILASADAILIDRGDLSREVAIERIPFVQKDIIRQANHVGVPVHVATNLLESMVTDSRPTRAEVNDVANTLMDGADGLVLAAETAIGKFPVQCVTMVRSIIHQFESNKTVSGAPSTEQNTSGLPAPHGGKLIYPTTANISRQELADLPHLEIDQYIMMDIAQIAVGAFSPIQGFMTRETLESVLEENCLPDGTLWPMPILFQQPRSGRAKFQSGETIVLTHNGIAQALLNVEDCFSYNLETLSRQWFGTVDAEHAGVARIMTESDNFIAGEINLLSDTTLPKHPYELTPAQTRYIFEHRNWQKVVGFHTRNVPHRAHEYIQLTALAEHDCDGIFVHPVIGPKKIGDYSGDIILKSYDLLINQVYGPSQALLGGFVTYSRFAGPREAVFTAICRQNFGCTHFIVGRDHTGVGDFYHADASKRMFDEIGDLSIMPVFFDEVYYCQACGEHVERCRHGVDSSEKISGTLARNQLQQGMMLPNWYIREPISALILEELKNGNEVFID